MVILVGIFAFALGVWRFLIRIERGRTSCIRWPENLAAWASLTSWVSFGLVLVLSRSEGVLGLAARQIGIYLFLAGRLLVWVASRIGRSLHASGQVTLRALVRERVPDQVAAAREAMKRAYLALAPTGWGEFQLAPSSLDRLMDIRNWFRGYLLTYFLVLVFVPIIVAIGFVSALNSGPLVSRRIMGAYVGYVALSTTSWLTLALIVTICVSVGLVLGGFFVVQPSIKAALGSVAACTGYGTAAGVVTAALIPIVSIGHYRGSAGSNGGSVAIVPQLLIDMPAAFAAAGYLLGLLVAAVQLFVNAANLVLRRIVVPGILVGSLILLDNVGLGSTSIIIRVREEVGDISVSACSESVLNQHLDDPAWLLGALGVCDSGADWIQGAWLLRVFIFLTAAVSGIASVYDLTSAAAGRPHDSNSSLTPH